LINNSGIKLSQIRYQKGPRIIPFHLRSDYPKKEEGEKRKMTMKKKKKFSDPYS